MNDTIHLNMKTYIIITKENEIYCGKTTDIEKRLDEHKKEKRGWFNLVKSRKEFYKIYIIDGDYEKKIKTFGVRSYLLSVNQFKEFERCIVS